MSYYTTTVSAFKLITHPAMVLSSIAAIMIVGPNNAGLFFEYIVGNFEDFPCFETAATLGLAFFLIAFLIESDNATVSHLLNITGILLLQCSVILLFCWFPVEYTYATFQGLPLFMIMLASLCSMASLFRHIVEVVTDTVL